MNAQDPHRDLLERATVALERQEQAFERQEQSLERILRTMDQRDTRAEGRHDHMLRRADEHESRAQERHERQMRRFARSEKLFVEALGDIDLSIRRSIERLDDMGEAIRANTAAVVAMLDRLPPPPAAA